MAECSHCRQILAVAAPRESHAQLERLVPALVHELRNALAALNMGLELADLRLAAAGSQAPALQPQAAPVLARAQSLCGELLQLARPAVGPATCKLLRSG